MLKSRSKGNIFASREGYKRILHYAFNLGIEVAGYSDSTRGISNVGSPVDTALIAQGFGFGWRLGLEFNPVYTRYMSLGLKSNAIVTSAPFKQNETSLRYRALINEVTLTTGLTNYKLFARLQNVIENYSINTKLENNLFARVVNKTRYSVGYGIGFRIGGTTRMDGQIKAGRAFDFYYLNRNTSNSYQNMFESQSGYAAGFGLQYWVQSGTNLGLEVISNKRYPHVFPSEFPDFSAAQFRLVLLAVIDNFY